VVIVAPGVQGGGASRSFVDSPFRTTLSGAAKDLVSRNPCRRSDIDASARRVPGILVLFTRYGRRRGDPNWSPAKFGDAAVHTSQELSQSGRRRWNSRFYVVKPKRIDESTGLFPTYS
jgi:hypothetical protein